MFCQYCGAKNCTKPHIKSRSRQFCVLCGVKLSRKNAYRDPNKRQKLDKKCKECRKKSRNQRYKVKNKKFVLRLSRDIFKEFDTLQERHDFQVGRKIQARWGRPRVTPGSNSSCGKSVWHAIKESDGKATYKSIKCQECGGTVRYDEHNYQVCEQCGLIHNYQINKLIFEDDYRGRYARKQGKSASTTPILRGSTDEVINCFDKYYSRAYGKKLA